MNTNTSIIYHYEQGSRRKAVTLLQPQEQRHSVRAADNTAFKTREARRMLQKEKLGRAFKMSGGTERDRRSTWTHSSPCTNYKTNAACRQALTLKA